jgi:hypothetical protein
MYLATTPPANINYCLISNEVQRVHIGGRLLLDKEAEIVRSGWLKQLINFVVENEYHIDKGNGIPAFVRGLDKNGHLNLR